MTELAVREPTTMQANAPGALVAWAEAASAAHRLASPLVSTDFVPAHFRPKNGTEEAYKVAQASATAAILFGAEAGLTPMQALQGIYVISGKPAMYARVMLAVTLAQGHAVWTEELTDTKAVVCGQRRGSEHVERVTWTLDRASKAGYTSNKKYATDPQSMLLARAQSDVCRRIAPDAILGMAYSVEELEDEGEDLAAPRKRTAKRAAPSTPEPEFASPEEAAAEAATDQGDDNQDPPEPPLEPDAATDAQLSKLAIQFDEAGYTDRDDKLRYLSNAFGRPIGSSRELSKSEASFVIDAFEAGTILGVGEGVAL